jgi:hypothetical protein
MADFTDEYPGMPRANGKVMIGKIIEPMVRGAMI